MEKNKSIECSITNCKNHAENSEYCQLSKITVGAHEANPTKAECTDCNSFHMK